MPRKGEEASAITRQSEGAISSRNGLTLGGVSVAKGTINKVNQRGPIADCEGVGENQKGEILHGKISSRSTQREGRVIQAQGYP